MPTSIIASGYATIGKKIWNVKYMLTKNYVWSKYVNNPTVIKFTISILVGFVVAVIIAQLYGDRINHYIDVFIRDTIQLYRRTQPRVSKKGQYTMPKITAKPLGMTQPIIVVSNNTVICCITPDRKLKQYTYDIADTIRLTICHSKERIHLQWLYKENAVFAETSFDQRLYYKEFGHDGACFRMETDAIFTIIKPDSIRHATYLYPYTIIHPQQIQSLFQSQK
jgi:hypothetical protein